MSQAAIARRGVTLVELLVAIAVIGILMALLLPATQAARAAARRAECANRIRQVGIALHGFHDTERQFPAGLETAASNRRMPNSTWIVAILPFLEQASMFDKAAGAFAADQSPFNNPPHTLMAHSLRIVECPADSRVLVPQITRRSRLVELSSFMGISGTDVHSRDGVLFGGSQIRLADITDGASNTLLVGERPPSPDFFYGWWYAGFGQRGTGSVTIVLGIHEMNLFTDDYGSCIAGPYQFAPGRIDQPCDRFHYWSLHSGGGNFAMADGGVRFLPYSADAVLGALSTRSGGEAESLP